MVPWVHPSPCSKLELDWYIRFCGARGCDQQRSTEHGAAVTTGTILRFAHVPLSPSSIIWYRQGAVMPCSWEGNRRSGVPLAMRHRLQWFIHVRTRSRSKKGGEHPACTDQITIISRRRGRLNGRATDRLCLASSFILFHRL